MINFIDKNCLKQYFDQKIFLLLELLIFKISADIFINENKTFLVSTLGYILDSIKNVFHC